ncbi:MAG: DNA cytosine methyltransferase [Desulfurococcaceae archaeon]
MYKFIDLFAGAGGFSLGFHLTGRFRCLLAIDNFKFAALTYKANFPQTAVVAEDIKSIAGSLITRVVKEEEIDLVIGSPPCEPFTAANPERKRDPLDRLYLDPRGQLTLHFIRIVAHCRPRIFIMENVPAIMENGLRGAISNELERAGYSEVYFNILRAEHYGVPSRRTRVFISNVPIRPPPLKYLTTVDEALKGLPEPGAPFIPNHEPPPELPWSKLKKAVKLKRGQALVYYQGARKLLPNLIKLDPGEIAPTVLGSSRFIHPHENRLLTVREQARLVGFPDTFIFIGGRDSQYNMIGEAVPPPLAKSVAEFILPTLERGDL